MSARRSISGCYREYAPHPALRGHVRTFFSFTPAPGSHQPARPVISEALLYEGAERAPSFADASSSIVLELPASCDAQGHWGAGNASTRATMIGPMSQVSAVTADDLPAMVGAYLHPTAAARFAGQPADALADRVVPLADLWGRPRAVDLEDQGADRNAEAAIDALELALLRRIRHGDRSAAPTVKLEQLVAWARSCGGRISVDEVASAAGISRQHLGRLFRRHVGISPKLFCRLARFQAALAVARAEKPIWAQAAATLGYADQSHMIAELREFAGFTPDQLARGRIFHPLIERAGTGGSRAGSSR